MIELYVSSYGGRPPPVELKGRFGSEGGTVGRDAENRLVLPDRHVSRLQARVRYDGTRYLIANLAEANPIFVNDAEVDASNEQPLVVGDEVRIGLYLLGVRLLASVEKAGARAPERATQPISGHLDAVAAPQSATADANPIADVLPSAPLGSPRPAGRIPDKFDPIAMRSTPPRDTQDRSRDHAEAGVDIRAADHGTQPSALLDVDAAPNPPQLDVQDAPGDAAVVGAHVSPAPLGAGSSKTPAAEQDPGAAIDVGASIQPADLAATERPTEVTRPQSAAPNADVDALQASFLKGIRMTDLSGPVRLTPALMEMMGSLVYHATAGAIELIAAMQITKREMRAHVTMLGAERNNPLKFLPTPEAAILQMLGSKIPGFMKMDDAMHEAFDDLRAHEVGVITGMRAALAELVRRFDPALVDRRLVDGGMLDKLIPFAPRARLWDLFEARFRELDTDDRDNFQSLFAAAFAKAYEEQIELDRSNRRCP